MESGLPFVAFPTVDEAQEHLSGYTDGGAAIGLER